MKKAFVALTLLLLLCACVQQERKHSLTTNKFTAELKKFYIKNNTGWIQIEAKNNSSAQITEFFIMMKFIDAHGKDVWTFGECIKYKDLSKIPKETIERWKKLGTFNEHAILSSPLNPGNKITIELPLPPEAKITEIKDYQILKLELKCP
ncbi:MAG: hypothetical protein DRO04_02790 [Candidatus Iainarchaeum archaeon]|uniref:Lipoprotein n=1 Tax=Candidatus Iainarchaeum sp. TaxID=3101447 RepID=A0A497JHF8_9ARCH|nr:MAG: hypothetical protein DRO04_02790 [Candidatus Diapherotrites archaeon]